MESILTSIKKLLGIAEDDTHFDHDIILHINSAFAILCQLGVGPVTGFRISDKTTIWDDYLGDSVLTLDEVKDYIFLKVKLVFDPPTVGGVLEMMKETIQEYEWRLNVTVD